jgi:hypothetical protein
MEIEPIIIISVLGVYTGLLLYLNAKRDSGEGVTSSHGERAIRPGGMLRSLVSIMGLGIIGPPLILITTGLVVLVLIHLGIINPDSLFPR